MTQYPKTFVEQIKMVNQYAYLGFTLIPSGKIYQGIETLINKEKKNDGLYFSDFYINLKEKLSTLT